MSKKKRKPSKHSGQHHVPATVKPSAPPSASSTLVTREERYSGPLPHPNLLRAFNDIIPNGAERIMQDYETQAAHRRELESLVIKSDIRRADMGLYLGFAIGIVFSVGGLVLLYTGKSLEGFAALGSVVLTFFISYGVQLIKRQAERKAQSGNQAQGEQ